jgi:hypothetical protein
VSGRRPAIDLQEAFNERAAIIQFCSGVPAMTREESERIASAQMALTDDEAEFLMGAEAIGQHGSGHRERSEEDEGLDDC